MTTFSARAARKFLIIKAAKEFKKEIEQAGVDNLKTLADAGISILLTYLNGLAAQDKVNRRRELNALLRVGVTPDMILTELTRQMPEIAPILESREGYKEGEIQKLTAFLTET
ncbi:hypothetical protein LCGC14_1058750 [marine sediment metagenome]|uniref:Uncharacterized protein n=1 Tax=marine sediment metagenome TaxID=412755 RepID=A0A0F9Q4K8_9ZZZZ